ncbi:MAG: HesB/IscA family protein [Leptothrix sp. (in: b-proteobacteria)]|jgi:iron-sulfur cluster assembly accessory protein
MILPNVTVTPAAQKFISRMVRFSEHPAGGFRLQVSPGGCSGYNAEFTVEAAPKEGDAELALGGTRVFLPAESRLLLDGFTMDFADTPTKSGLTFTSPTAASCACSSSGDAAPPAQATFSLSSLKRI